MNNVLYDISVQLLKMERDFFKFWCYLDNIKENCAKIKTYKVVFISISLLCQELCFRIQANNYSVTVARRAFKVFFYAAILVQIRRVNTAQRSILCGKVKST